MIHWRVYLGGVSCFSGKFYIFPLILNYFVRFYIITPFFVKDDIFYRK